MRTGIFYGSTTGNTQEIARQIFQVFGSSAAEPVDIATAEASAIESFDLLIFGTSTWGAGELQDDWQDALSILDDVDLTGKKVAIFGLGDQEGYSDTFVDGMADIAKKARSRGAIIVGQVPVDGYDFVDSAAIENGMFTGLPIDIENQDDKTAERITAWIERLKAEIA